MIMLFVGIIAFILAFPFAKWIHDTYPNVEVGTTRSTIFFMACGFVITCGVRLLLGIGAHLFS